MLNNNLLHPIYNTLNINLDGNFIIFIRDEVFNLITTDVKYMVENKLCLDYSFIFDNQLKQELNRELL